MSKKRSGKSTRKTVRSAAVLKPSRNRVACNPLLRKGGPHVKAKSGERFSGKQQTRKAAREWQGSRAHDTAFTVLPPLSFPRYPFLNPPPLLQPDCQF